MRPASIIAVSVIALVGCAAPRALTRSELSSTLTGYQETPQGDLDGTGTARIRVDAEEGRVCWELNARGIDRATAAHIHRGEAGSVGPPVVPLTTPDEAGRSEGCAPAPAELAREMIVRAHGFYVNVHNAAFPGGAIRGQLRGQPRRNSQPSPPPGRQ